jgi:hypothetical protein
MHPCSIQTNGSQHWVQLKKSEFSTALWSVPDTICRRATFYVTPGLNAVAVHKDFAPPPLYSCVIGDLLLDNAKTWPVVQTLVSDVAIRGNKSFISGTVVAGGLPKSSRADPRGGIKVKKENVLCSPDWCLLLGLETSVKYNDYDKNRFGHIYFETFHKRQLKFYLSLQVDSSDKYLYCDSRSKNTDHRAKFKCPVSLVLSPPGFLNGHVPTIATHPT